MSRVLITGASRGLGRSLVMVLSEHGHQVIATARQVVDLSGLEVAQRLALDVTDPVSVAAALEAAGEVDVLINNAALTAEGPLEAMPEEVLAAMMATNVLGPLRLSQAVLPGMRTREHGMIVNISSLAGQFAPPLQGMYAATKAALEQLSEALWFETRHFGIHVVVVAAGGIRTGMVERQAHYTLPPYAPLIQQQDQRMAGYQSQNRGIAPEQVAETIASLIQQKHPPRRIVVGITSERWLAQLSGPMMSRLTRMGLKW